MSMSANSPASQSVSPATPAEIDASCRVPVMVLFAFAAVWLVTASFFGLIVSLKFHMPGLLADRPWFTYGRAQAPITDDQDPIVTAEVATADIEEVIARWTGIPVVSLKEEDTQKLLRIETELHKRVVSQRPAISALARAIRRSRAGLKNPHRPVGSFLFLGPTGVGKTEVARSLAQFLFGNERSMIRFDMSEFMEKHSISKLIGSPLVPSPNCTPCQRKIT